MPWNKLEGFEISIAAKKKKGKSMLMIGIPMEDPPTPSKTTGRNMLIASTHGVLKTDLVINNRNVRVCINAFYPILNNKKCTTGSKLKKNTKIKE